MIDSVELLRGEAMIYTHFATLKVPSPVACASFDPSRTNVLAIGSGTLSASYGSSARGTELRVDDGTLRVYEFPATKVVNAVKDFKHDISSIQWLPPTSDEQDFGRIWVASGPYVRLYVLSKVVLYKCARTVGL